MLERIIAAVIALAILTPVVAFGGYWGFYAVAFVAMLISTREFCNMVFTGQNKAQTIQFVYSSALFASVSLFPEQSLSLCVLSSVFTFSVILFVSPDNESGLKWIMGSSFGGIYTGMLMGYFPLLRDYEDGLFWLGVALISTWAADTGAYFAGRFAGHTLFKRKLFPRVSPKKTIEGVIGGVLLTVAFLVYTFDTYVSDASIYVAIVLGVTIALFSVVGDLLESLLKRAVGVKDSGKLMPGHGGALDRLDSLLFTVPLVYVLLEFFGLK